MTTTKQELYGVLEELRSTYQVNLEQMATAAVLDYPPTGYTNHQAEDATAMYEQTVAATTVKAMRDRLRQVEAALVRYEAGTYGICDSCGREIDIARLEAIPYTPLCLHCAEAREYGPGA